MELAHRFGALLLRAIRIIPILEHDPGKGKQFPKRSCIDKTLEHYPRCVEAIALGATRPQN
jgi:hypothetical protein